MAQLEAAEGDIRKWYAAALQLTSSGPLARTLQDRLFMTVGAGPLQLNGMLTTKFSSSSAAGVKGNCDQPLVTTSRKTTTENMTPKQINLAADS